MSNRRRSNYRNNGDFKDKSVTQNKKPDELAEERIKKVFQEHADEVLADLATKMDEEFMETGKDIAELYRAICTAAAKLPTMELHTDLICVTNSDEGLTVVFHRENAESGHDRIDFGTFDDDFDFDDYDDDEEEGLLYDGD